MIDPKLLTKENGFDSGTVVSINGRPYVFDYFGKYADGFIDAVWTKGGPTFTPEKILSIIPLTGPMSIWNHAPEWANFYVNRHDMKRSAFVAQLSLYMIYGPHAEKYNNDWSPRPFWAKHHD